MGEFEGERGEEDNFLKLFEGFFEFEFEGLEEERRHMIVFFEMEKS